MFLGRCNAVSVSKQVGIRPVFIDMFLGSAVSVSEQVGIRLVWNDMFLGSVMSVPEQVSIRLTFSHISRNGGECVCCRWVSDRCGMTCF